MSQPCLSHPLVFALGGIPTSGRWVGFFTGGLQASPVLWAFKAWRKSYTTSGAVILRQRLHSWA